MPYNACMPQVGETYVEVRADTSKVGSDIEKGVTQEVKKAEKAVGGFADAWKKVELKGTSKQIQDVTSKAVLPAGIALTAVSGAFTFMAKKAEEAEIAQRRLASVMSSMGYPQATARVSAYADELEKNLAIDGELIKATQTKLATFANLTKTVGEAGGAFDRATVAALDLAAAGFGSAETNAVQLGKALQDPIKGIGALARAGVTFTAQEKEKIKTLVESGQTLQAQDLILKAIETQVGGTAKASKSSFAAIQISLENAAESIGSVLLPVINLLAGVFEGFASFAKNNTGLFITLGVVVGGIAAAIIAVNTALKVQMAIETISAGIKATYALITGTATTAIVAETVATTAATAAQVGLNTAMALNPIGIIVIAVLALVAAFVIAYKKIDWFRNGVNKIINAIIGYFEFMINVWIKVINGLTSGVNKLTGFLSKIGIDIPKIGQIAEVTFGRIADAAKKAASAADFRKFEESTKNLGGAAEDTTPKITGLGGAADKAGEAAKAAAAKVKTLRDEMGKGFEENLKKAGSVLETARKAFSDFAVDVGKAVTSAFSFGDSFKTVKENSTNLTKAIKDQTDAENKLAEARKGNDPTKIADATADLAVAIKAVGEAQKQPLTFLDDLAVQATKAKDFGVLVNRLIAGGLSESALQQVLSAGVDAGSAIATELLSSADGILKANTLTAQVQAVGDQVGLNAAANFKQAGVTAGEALVAGVTEVISKYQVSLKSKKLTAKQLTKLQKDFAIDVEFQFSQGVPALANGGIFAGAQNAIIGEAGAEAVIPLTRPRRALDLMEQSGLATLARGQGSAVNIESATFVSPIDAQLLAAKVMVAERARSFAQ